MTTDRPIMTGKTTTQSNFTGEPSSGKPSGYKRTDYLRDLKKVSKPKT